MNDNPTYENHPINKYLLSFRNNKGQLQNVVCHAATPEDAMKNFMSKKKNHKFIVLGVRPA